MKLNEAEMRMAYQIESTDPNAVLNEIYMTWRLSRNQATRDTAESLMAKLRSPRSLEKPLGRDRGARTKTDTGGRVEHTEAIGATMVKELGIIVP